MIRTDGDCTKVNIWHALLAGICILASFVVVLFICSVTPFGDKTFLMYDLKRQYADYYAYYRTVLSGENNIFYSFSTALGSGTLGFFAYYLTSPFLIILSLFDKAYIPVGVSLIIGLKLSLAAFFMDIFLQKNVIGKADLSTLLGAVSYAFSGFLFAQSMNMMWMDVVILLPIYISCLEELLETGKKTFFILLLSLMLILNYYITYQVLIFTGLWTLLYIWVKAPVKPFKLIGRVIYSCLIAGLIPMVLLLPTALELMNSPKDVSQLGLGLSGKNLGLIDLLSKLPTHAYDQIEPRFGYPQLFCGVLITILTLMYFLSKSVPKRERIGFGVMILIFLVSFGVEVINLFWHAGMAPSGHPYRQAFMWVFILTICGSRAFDVIRDEIALWKIAGVTVLMAAALFLIKRGEYDHISRETLILNAVLLLGYGAVLAALYVVNKRHEKIATVILTALFAFNMLDLISNAAFTYDFEALKCEMASSYREGIVSKEAAVKKVKEYDSSFYRMEDLNPRQQNDGLQYDYNGVTHYSSAGKIYVRYLLQRLGYNDDTLYTHYGHDNTMTMDSILGIRYVLSDGTYATHPEYQLLFEGEDSSYVNPYALSVAVGTKDFDLSEISDDILNSPDSGLFHVPGVDVFSLQEDIYGRLLGREVSLFEAAEVDESGRYEKDDKYVYDYEVEATADGELFFYLDDLIGAEESLSIFVDDEFISTYGNASCVKILNLGYHHKGDQLLLSVQAEDEDAYFGEVFFVTEKAEALRSAYNELSGNMLTVTEKSSSHLRIEAGDYNGVFLSIPFEEGWHFRVDGKKTEGIAIYDALTYVPINTEGKEHVIEMYFVPKGIHYGVVLSLIGIMLFILTLVPVSRRETVLRAFAVIGAGVILISMLMTSKDDNVLEDEPKAYALVKGQKIDVFKSGDRNYLFLPSFAAKKDTELSKAASKMDLDILKSENIASVFITTNSGSIEEILADKDYKEHGKITVFDKNGRTDLSGGLKYLKGRGNYSWNNWDKKPFKIRLSEEADILGLGKGLDFSLIANASDATLLRNDLARHLEKAVGIPFAAEGKFIDLYINGEYLGNYYLCKNIELGEDGIDITNLDEVQADMVAKLDAKTLKPYETPKIKGWNLPDVASDITGGYLLEREFVDRYNLEYDDIHNGFVTDHEEHYIVISPDYCSASEIIYISDYFNESEKEIYTGENLGSHIDLESFAKRYVVEEVLKNYDGGVSSAYYYKDSDLIDGHIYAGPGWDFDMSLGNYLDWMEYYDEDATGITGLYLSEHSSTYYKNLIKYDEFNALVKRIYKEDVEPFMMTMIEQGIDDSSKEISSSAYMDSIRWKSMYEELEHSTADESEYRDLKDFIAVRISFLNNEWLKQA